MSLQPVLFCSHGGGPSWLMTNVPGMDSNSPACKSFRQCMKMLYPEGGRPNAIVVVSAHWEADRDQVQVLSASKLLFDYYGFPAHTYEIKYPCPTSPDLVENILEKLKAAGIKASDNPSRGFDHGVFIPLTLMVPEADIPVVQVSLSSSMNPAFHLGLGKALAPLRSEGVLIIGSGQATHNLSERINGPPPVWAKEWQSWMDETTMSTWLSREAREERLKGWAKAPHAKTAHPREEHLLPLLVCAAAADYSVADELWSGWSGSMSLSSYAWR